MASKPEDWHGISEGVSDIIKRYFVGLVPPKELHYSDLIHRKAPFNKINALPLAGEVFDLIAKLNVTLFAMVINKEEHWKRYLRPFPPPEYALEAMTNRFQRFLERQGAVGAMVLDRVGAADEALLKMFERFKTEGTMFQRPTRIIDTVFFTPSETSVLLQLADFCAYAVFSKFEHNKPKRFDQIQSKIDSYGLRVFPE